MTALLAVGAVGLVVVAALSAKALPSRPARLGYAVAAVVWLAAGLVFFLDDELFVHYAHGIAAGAMFLFIFGVVLINTREYKDKGPATSVRNRYGLIAGGMAVSFVVFPILGCLGWHHWVLGIEIALISLFAVFWGIQTKELWNEGLRSPAAPSP